MTKRKQNLWLHQLHLNLQAFQEEKNHETSNMICLTVLLLFLLLIACAEDPKTTNRAPSQRDRSVASQPDPGESRIILQTASVYEGRTTLAPFRPCTLFISTEKEEGTHGNETATEKTPAILVKLEYIIHGQKIMDTVVDFYKYNPNLDKFFEKDSNEPETHLALLSILVEDEGEIDPNKILEYEGEKTLIQTLRIDFQNNEKDIEQAVIRIKHAIIGLNGKEYVHYDYRACENFKLTGTREVEFDLSHNKHQ